MKIPKLDNAAGYGELIPQTIWHQLAARVLAALLGWAVLEHAKETTKIGQQLLGHALGPADKLWKISLPYERRRARDGLARLERDVTGVADGFPQPDPRTVADANGPGRHLFVCGERFLGDYDVWRTCNRSPHQDGEHDDFLDIDGQDRPLRLHPSDSPDAEQTLDDLPGVVSGLPYVDQLAAEVEPETTEA